jgi:hydantoinase/carbamoylase family amidase
MLGVLLGVALVESLSQCDCRLPFAIEVVGFSEEEGVRHATPFIGSKALAGGFDPALLDRVDAHGIMLGDALRAFGGSPESIDSAAMDPARVVAYLEAHIEQGPVLQNEGLPLGAVLAIAGQTRLEVRCVGAAGHAGTTPMNLRRDAVAAAAEWILQVERVGRESIGMVATVGVVEVAPNVANVIPGAVRLRLDLRHADDAVRDGAVQELFRLGQELSARRHVLFEWKTLHVHHAVEMDDAVTAVLMRSLTDAGVRPLKLVSGAGHDAAEMARRFPAAMLFVRCRDGVSHHPDESVEHQDVALALTAMWHFVRRLALGG